jgi:cytochrome c peroxidase
MRTSLKSIFVWAACLGSSAVPVVRAEEPIAALPLSVTADPARTALGARLYRDARLSRDKTTSCAGCHPLDRGGTAGEWPVQMKDGSKVERNTPTIFNVALNLAFNWDGSARTLEDVVDGVVRHPARFANDWPTIMQRLRADGAYVSGFKGAYPDGLTVVNVRDALVEYQRTLVTPNARFDRYLRGERSAITPAELSGYSLFKSFGCAACHQGVNIGGNLYQRLGVFRSAGPGPQDGADPGRFRVTGKERDRLVFRVPSLRNVELTAPYFHDGRAHTLRDAVQTMARVQLDRELRPQENDSIVLFLRTLTGELDGRPLLPPPSVMQSQGRPR